jgi:hypothetical protein
LRDGPLPGELVSAGANTSSVTNKLSVSSAEQVLASKNRLDLDNLGGELVVRARRNAGWSQAPAKKIELYKTCLENRPILLARKEIAFLGFTQLLQTTSLLFVRV